jgi:hypothetical protein
MTIIPPPPAEYEPAVGLWTRKARKKAKKKKAKRKARKH